VKSLFVFVIFQSLCQTNVQINILDLSMPVTNAQKAAAEQVIDAIKGVTSPRKKRVLAELFLELVDKETWANYYEVPSNPRPALS
jgi:hypothetical protein